MFFFRIRQAKIHSPWIDSQSFCDCCVTKRSRFASLANFETYHENSTKGCIISNRIIGGVMQQELINSAKSILLVKKEYKLWLNVIIYLLFQNLNFITTITFIIQFYLLCEKNHPSLSYQSPLFQHNQPPPLYAINRCITMAIALLIMLQFWAPGKISPFSNLISI